MRLEYTDRHGYSFYTQPVDDTVWVHVLKEGKEACQRCYEGRFAHVKALLYLVICAGGNNFEYDEGQDFLVERFFADVEFEKSVRIENSRTRNLLYHKESEFFEPTADPEEEYRIPTGFEEEDQPRSKYLRYRGANISLISPDHHQNGNHWDLGFELGMGTTQAEMVFENLRDAYAALCGILEMLRTGYLKVADGEEWEGVERIRINDHFELEEKVAAEEHAEHMRQQQQESS